MALPADKAALARAHSKAAARPRALSAKRVRNDSSAFAVKQARSTNLKKFV
jgi:hypothetical protein